MEPVSGAQLQDCCSHAEVPLNIITIIDNGVDHCVSMCSSNSLEVVLVSKHVQKSNKNGMNCILFEQQHVHRMKLDN